jgi:ribosomal protein S18 acetylase RimI-like enzyme
MPDPQVRIRPAAMDDVDALVDIHRRARDTYYRGVVPDQRLDDPAEHAELHDAYRRTIASSERTLLVAELDGEAVGLASLGPPIEPVVGADPQTVGQMIGLYVKPGHWDRRIGSSLHEECIRVWQAHGVTTGRLEVWEHNQRARSFYARRGWRADGYRRPGPGDSSFLRLCLAVPEG